MNPSKSMRIALAMKEWNQAQLAERAGISQPAVSSLANRAVWNTDSLQKIANAFGMKVSEFVALAEE